MRKVSRLLKYIVVELEATNGNVIETYHRCLPKFVKLGLQSDAWLKQIDILEQMRKAGMIVPEKPRAPKAKWQVNAQSIANIMSEEVKSLRNRNAGSGTYEINLAVKVEI